MGRQNTPVRHNSRNWLHRSLYGLLIVFLAVLIAAVCIFSVVNANGLKNAVGKSTQAYVNDVTFQMAQNISAQLFHVMQDLEMLSDSLVRMDDTDARMEFLKRKTPMLGFTQLVLCGLDGKGVCTDGSSRDFSGLPGFEASAAGEHGVSFLDNQRILYTIPILYNGTVSGVLAGERDKANMQALIETDGFDGNSVSCIIDRDGNVIISPADLDFFVALDDLFVADEHPELTAAIEQMQTDMQASVGGLLSFTTSDNVNVVMSYDPLDIFDWVLLTILPADIISHDTDAYIQQTFLLSAAVILLFSLVLAAMCGIYYSHRRQLEHIAFVDPLTGGMNSARFQYACRHVLNGAKPGAFTVVSLNLMDYRLINEIFGPQDGNDTLRHVMRMLERRIRPDEAAARGEAGRFFLCLHEHREDAVIARLDEIRADVNAFNAQREQPYYLTLLAGAYLVQNPETDVAVMQDRADAARKSKPAESGRCAFYDAGITERMQWEKELANLLDSSLANRDFKVYYQPKVRLRDGRTASAEALVRWQHPQKGFIYPSDFIPVFERNGDICRLDLYVFEEVCAMLAGRLAQGAPVFPVAVNLSRQHFQTPDFLRRFADIRDQYQIPDGLIELELTESIFFTVGDILNVKEAIRRMHELGFLCSLDDFGAGFSSLGLLKSFMVDSVKLDRSFFLEDSQRAHDVVESIVELARKLGIETVAEGIEAPEQVEFLRSVGCDLVQGYVYARPMPAEELEAWMHARNDGETPRA